MTAAAVWARYRVQIIAAVLLAAAVALSVSSIRSSAAANERARVADSTAKVEQRNRVRTDRAAAVARAQADSLFVAVRHLTKRADSVAAIAREAAGDARRSTETRRAAAAAIARAQNAADSITALIAKSAADDTLIGALQVVVSEKSVEATALRSALDSAAVARLTLASALDSARAQLNRDGQVIQQLQAAVRSARPTSGPRVAKLSLAAGVGYCAAPDLTPRLCGAVVAGPSLRLF